MHPYWLYNCVNVNYPMIFEWFFFINIFIHYHKLLGSWTVIYYYDKWLLPFYLWFACHLLLQLSFSPRTTARTNFEVLSALASAAAAAALFWDHDRATPIATGEPFEIVPHVSQVLKQCPQSVPTVYTKCPVCVTSVQEVLGKCTKGFREMLRKCPKCVSKVSDTCPISGQCFKGLHTVSHK